MTYEQLKNDVAHLGFEREIEDEEALILAANRALDIIFTDRPVKTRITLYSFTDECRLLHERLHKRGGDSISVPLSGKAVSFRLCGKGSYTIKNGKSTRKYNFSSALTEARHFINGDAAIVFEGEVDYEILMLACFSGTKSDLEDDIPIYSERKEIDPTCGKRDLRAFVSLPTDKQGNPINGALLHGEKIILPQSYEGQINIEYYRTPEKITNYDSIPIDISKDSECLLPLLTASFMWLDDDPAKAQYYMALYNETLGSLRRRALKSLDTSYRTNGWA